jgi:hypothetical protein
MWNYRLVQLEEFGDTTVEMFEVYYDHDEVPRGYCQAKIMATPDTDGDPKASIRWTLDRMQEAVQKPILHYPQDFTGKAL